MKFLGDWGLRSPDNGKWPEDPALYESEARGWRAPEYSHVRQAGPVLDADETGCGLNTFHSQLLT